MCSEHRSFSIATYQYQCKFMCNGILYGIRSPPNCTVCVVYFFVRLDQFFFSLLPFISSTIWYFMCACISECMTEIVVSMVLVIWKTGYKLWHLFFPSSFILMIIYLIYPKTVLFAHSLTHTHTHTHAHTQNHFLNMLSIYSSIARNDAVAFSNYYFPKRDHFS